jgi:hypothetical protein
MGLSLHVYAPDEQTVSLHLGDSATQLSAGDQEQHACATSVTEMMSVLNAGSVASTVVGN